MATTVKAITLSVRPVQASHLCFEFDGILGELHVQLGSVVTPFDFDGFHATLGAIPTIPGDLSRIKYDFLDIQNSTKKMTLAALRAEPAKAALHKAINGRQNAFLAKYGHIPEIVTRTTNSYSPTVVETKPVLLQVLATASKSQFDDIQNAYLADGRTGVVRSTVSHMTSTTESSATSTDTGSSNENRESSLIPTSIKLHTLPPGGGSIAGWGFKGDQPVTEDFVETTSGSQTTSRGTAQQSDLITTTDYAYRAPYHELTAQFTRARISLLDEQFNLFMSTLNLPRLGQSLLNELNSIDADVFRLQIAYLNTILLSPIAGIVTGLYKQPGEAVRAGEPVIRVEDNATILLTGILSCPAPVALGATLTVSRPSFDGTGPNVSINGPVVAVRGRPEGDDRWEVVAKCSNLDSASKPIFPLGYHFDYDDTIVTIT